MISLTTGLTLIAALGCAAIGGVFFAFTSFVMGALRRLPPAQGIAAMQTINVVAVTPAFMTALFGTALACLAVAVRALLARDQAGGAVRIAAVLLYLVGVIGVTMARNVPLNNELAAADPAGPSSATLWTHFVQRWTTWNTVRTIAALLASGLLVLSLMPSRAE